MTSVFLLLLIGVFLAICAGLRESAEITEAAPPSRPTTDAYLDSWEGMEG